MNKDDVLARSRAENRGIDEYETQVLGKAGRFAAQAGLLACCAVAAAGTVLAGRASYSCWAICFAILSALFWTKWLHLKRRHELLLSGFYTAAGLLFAVLFVLELAG